MNFVDLALVFALLLTAFALLSTLFRPKRRTEAAANDVPRTILGVQLPQKGQPGSIAAKDAAELRRRAVISPDDTWLSREQAQLVLNCLRFGEAVWHGRCGQDGDLPLAAGKAVLEVFLRHDSYLMDIEIAAQGRGFGTESLPNDPCTRHLQQTLNAYLVAAGSSAPAA